MKRTFLISLIALLFVACESNTTTKLTKTTEQATTVAADLAKVETIELSVKGMTCGGCENSVKKSIKKLDGIAEVSASHEKENAIIKFDTTLTNKEKITAAITNAGYTVE